MANEMTVKQFAEICKKNSHCIECPLFYEKLFCDFAKKYINLGEVTFDVVGTKVENYGGEDNEQIH